VRIRHRIATGAALAAAAVAVLAAPASAHDWIVEAQPGDGATVTALSEVALTFSGVPIGQEGANLVEVRGPDGRYYETACPTLDGTDVTTPVALGDAGAYEVVWRIVSSDGHPVSGEYAFTYAPTDAEPADGAASPACAPEGAATDAPAPDAAGTPAASGSTAIGLWVGIGIGAAVLVLVAVGAWLLLRRPARRPDGPEDPDHPDTAG
jgi:copper resistance protein C